MNDKDKLILSKLAALVGKQQKLIHKLAQQQLPPDALPTSGTTYTQSTPVAPNPTSLKPNSPTHTEARVILNSLPPVIKNNLVDLQVHDGQVSIKWKTPVPDTHFDAVVKTVQNLQQQNALPGKNYKVVEKA